MGHCHSLACHGNYTEFAPGEKLPRGRKRDDGASDKGFEVNSWVYICDRCSAAFESSVRLSWPMREEE